MGEKFAAVRLVTWVLPPVYDLSVNYCAEGILSFFQAVDLFLLDKLTQCWKPGSILG